MAQSVLLALAATEKWLFLPAGFYYLWFTKEGLYVLYLHSQSPSQAYASVGHGHGGWKGKVSDYIGNKLADRAENKVESKMKELEQMTPAEALASNKRNFLIPAASITKVAGTYTKGQDLLHLYLHVNDSSAPWPCRTKRKFAIESDELGEVVDAIRKRCPYAVKL